MRRSAAAHADRARTVWAAQGHASAQSLPASSAESTRRQVIEGTRHFVVPGDTGCYGAWIGKRSTPHVPWRLNGSLFEVGFNNVHGILEPPAITRKYLLFIVATASGPAGMRT